MEQQRKLVTEIPGPRSRALWERRTRAVPAGVGTTLPIFVQRAQGGIVEDAVKIARAATGRPAVVAFDQAFHGRTLLALSLTAKVVPYKKSFGPYAPEVYRAPYSYPFRGTGGLAETIAWMEASVDVAQI